MPEIAASGRLRLLGVLAACLLAAACGGGGGGGGIAVMPGDGGDGGGGSVPSTPPAAPSYVSQQNGFEYRIGKTSPLEQAFADARIDAGRIDRSSKAFVFDLTLSRPHGHQIMTVLAANGLREGENYRYRQISSSRNFGNSPDFALVRQFYRATSADSITSMSFAPLFTTDPSQRGIDAKITDHSWVVAATGNAGNPGPLYLAPDVVTTSFDLALAAGTGAAAATGKLRYVYGLNAEQTGRHSSSNGCQQYERYCIGAPYEVAIEYGGSMTVIAGTSFATPYVFAVMLAAWERLDAGATLATVFAMADACAVDLGPEGPDADTGLGRLDIGCMAAATARAGGGASTAEAADGFVRDLFAARIGELQLPGATKAQMPVNLVGDSLRGHYHPALASGSGHYRPHVPEIRAWRPPGSAFGLAHGPPDEAGLHWRGGNLDAALTYRSSRDFFGGFGRGRFRFESTANLRLMLAGHLADGRLRWQAWSRFARIAGRPAAIDALHGHEIGAAITGKFGSGDTTLVVRAHLAQFRGGRIALAGGGSFPIAAGEPHYGLAVRIRHRF